MTDERRTQPALEAIGPLLSHQLAERVDFLFIYEKNHQVAVNVARGDNTDATVDTTRAEKAIVNAYADF